MSDDGHSSGRDDMVEFVVRASPDDIERLGTFIDQLRSDLGRTRVGSDQERSPTSLYPMPVSIARLLLLQRRDRGLAFADCDFGEAVWDVMLHLYVAHHEQRRVGAYALADIIDVPKSTALRWIATMEERGQLDRRPDPSDRRRSFVALTPLFRERIAAHLEKVRDEMLAISNERHERTAASHTQIDIGFRGTR